MNTPSLFKNPVALKPGDTIGIVAPSAGLAALFPHRVEQGVAALEQMGYRVIFAPHAREIDGYVSAPARDRAADLHLMFENPSVRAIVCMIGGNHANQVLKYLDYDLIAANPKILVGYSDITVLHWALAKKAGLRTFYGPCLISEFGEYPEMHSYTREYFDKAVVSLDPVGVVTPSPTWTDEFLDWGLEENHTRARTLTPSDGHMWWRTGVAEGPIFGGAIPSINHLPGTPYWVPLDDHILFIDIPEGRPGGPLSVASIDAFLADLDNLGVFKSIRGLIIGRPYRYEEEMRLALRDRVMQYVEAYSYPVLFDVNIGHAAPIITVPLGVNVRLDSTRDVFEVLESGVAR